MSRAEILAAIPDPPFDRTPDCLGVDVCLSVHDGCGAPVVVPADDFVPGKVNP